MRAPATQNDILDGGEGVESRIRTREHLDRIAAALRLPVAMFFDGLAGTSQCAEDARSDWQDAHELMGLIGCARSDGPSMRSAASGPSSGLGREFHVSQNDDRWLLRQDPDDGRSFVRHTGNPTSGGHVTDIGLSAFLAADRGSPEHRALWDLIGALAGGGRPAPPATSA